MYLDIEQFLSIIKDNNRLFFWEWLEFKPTETMTVWDRPKNRSNFFFLICYRVWTLIKNYEALDK